MGVGVWAVVVARVGSGAKSRLAPVLTPAARRRLALAMLSDVLDTCAAAVPPLAGTLAVVDDPDARWLAQRSGAVSVDDPGLGEMNAAVAAGIDAARAAGATTAIIVPGDVPLISRRDFVDLLSAAGSSRRAVIVGASRDGHGTNALLLRPPDVIAPRFGPPSVGRHVQSGLAHAASSFAVFRLGLALDVDTPADLAALDDLPVGPATAGFMSEFALAHAPERRRQNAQAST